jgi:NAD(P)H-flavin reductase
VYQQNEKYPEGGKMGRYVEKKQVGDYLTIDGPVGKHIYEGDGVINL